MVQFLETLKQKNEILFYYGLVCFFFALVFLGLTKLSNTEVYNVNAWYKPSKFALSTFIYAWSMAIYCSYLPSFNIKPFNWSIIILLGFEIVYIAFRASKGQTSHYNMNTPVTSILFSLMALAATLVTIYTAYIAVLFFSTSFTNLPEYYVWAIRLSLLIFVVFSFEGFAMGARLSHSVGAENDNSNLFILGWSKTFGDLRVAHFIGMHALQIIPLLSFYVLKNTKLTIGLAALYFLLAITTLIQALQGKPLFK